MRSDGVPERFRIGNHHLAVTVRARVFSFRSMADAHFESPRLAEIYDLLDSNRSDLGVFSDLVDELGASRIIDVGCVTRAAAEAFAPQTDGAFGYTLNLKLSDPAGTPAFVTVHQHGALELIAWQTMAAKDGLEVSIERTILLTGS